MNLQLDDVALFLRVRTLGTLSAVARERDVPVSQVSRALVRLEAACGARLLHRNTHGLSLTDEGDTFAAYGQKLLDTRAELAGEITGKHGEPSGWVRLAVSSVLAEEVVAPSVPGLYARHPQLHLDISADDRMVDMAREGIDIAIRTGTPAGDQLVARQIAAQGRTLYASPAYLARRGLPQHPDDLQHHHLIASSVNPLINHWTRRTGARADAHLAEDIANDTADGAPIETRTGARSHSVVPRADRATALQVRGDTRADSTALVLALVRHGAGIARLSNLVAAPLVRTGELVPLLRAWFDTPPVPVYAVMLQERHRLPKIRACIDYWAESLATGATPPAPIITA